jgi:hypothetical protein
MILPGWDSVDSVKSITSWLARATLTCWAALVLFEIIARVWDARKRLFDILALVAFAAAVSGEVIKYRYDERKDSLNEVLEQKLKQESQQQQREWEQERQRLQSQTEDAQRQIDKFNEQQRWRSVTKQQHDLLVTRLKPYAGTTVIMLVITVGGEEAQQYAEQIAKALRDAGWTVGVNAGIHQGEPRYDLTVVVNDQKHPHAATVLLDTLKEAKFTNVEGEASTNLSVDTFQIVVRPKPPTRNSSETKIKP